MNEFLPSNRYLPAIPEPSVNPSHYQMPTISTNQTPGNIPIPHTIQIRLRHISRLPHLARRHLRLETPHHFRPLRLRNPAPELRLHRARTDQIDPQRPQVERQLPRHAVQTRRVGAHYAPVRNRALGDAARRQRVAARGAGAEVCGEEFTEQQGREEAHHAGFLDESEVGVGELDGCEGVAGGVDDVVEGLRGVGGGLVEEGGEVGFEGGFGAEVAGVAGYAGGGGGVGGLEIGDGRGDAGGVGGGDGYGGAVFEGGFGDGVTDAWEGMLEWLAIESEMGERVPEEPPMTRMFLPWSLLVYFCWSAMVVDWTLLVSIKRFRC